MNTAERLTTLRREAGALALTKPAPDARLADAAAAAKAAGGTLTVIGWQVYEARPPSPAEAAMEAARAAEDAAFIGAAVAFIRRSGLEQYGDWHSMDVELAMFAAADNLAAQSKEAAWALMKLANTVGQIRRETAQAAKAQA